MTKQQSQAGGFAYSCYSSKAKVGNNQCPTTAHHFALNPNLNVRNADAIEWKHIAGIVMNSPLLNKRTMNNASSTQHNS